jgi:hypothetical protein
MTEHPSLDQLYRDVAARKKRRERAAMIAFVVIGSACTVLFFWSLFTPQP